MTENTATDTPTIKNTPTVTDAAIAYNTSEKPTEAPSGAKTQIVCDKFELVTKVTGSTLALSVDTDLPDNTDVTVRVSRSYLEKDNSATYSVDYFWENSTIGKWKSEHSISIDGEDWKTALRAKHEEMSRLGLDFDVASISDKIGVCITTGIRNVQADTLPELPWRWRNQYVHADVEIDYPMNAPPVGKSPFPSLDPMTLEIGAVYVVSRQTPLTPLAPSRNPTDADLISALQQIEQIPKGGGFKVLEVYSKRNDPWYNDPWYKVTAFDKSTQEIGTGWIYSLALHGQELQTHK
jgi:hypothetical protein